MQTRLVFQSGTLRCETPVAEPDRVLQQKDKRTAVVRDLVQKFTGHHTGATKRRCVYTEEDRRLITTMLSDAGGNASIVTEACRAVGMANIDRRTVRRMRIGDQSSRGRPVNRAFEGAVLSRVLFQTLSKVSQVTDITGNILHSLSMLQIAAADVVREVALFQNCPIVQRLKFSLHWAANVCRRNRLSKRSITCKSVSEMPEPSVIRRAQVRIQNRLEQGNYEPGDIISADETGINWKACDTHLYCPTNSERPPGDGDDKVRITCHLAGTAAGDMLPAHIILKCSCKDDARQEATTKLKHLLDKLTAAEPEKRWQCKTWSKTLDFDKGSKLYVRPYLINSCGDVISMQNNAWMDSAGCIFWLEEVVVPWAERLNRRPFIVWDNFDPHIKSKKVTTDGQVALRVAVEMEYLPPRCTRVLQVMDLVTNAVLKSQMRNMRLARIYNDFQNFRFQYAQATVDTKPFFRAPDIKESQGIMDLLCAVHSAFQTSKFKDGMKRAFVKVGLVPTPATNRFMLYPSEHPSSYKTWVKGLEAVAYEPCDKMFAMDELFDTLCLTRYEDSDELHQADVDFEDIRYDSEDGDGTTDYMPQNASAASDVIRLSDDDTDEPPQNAVSAPTTSSQSETMMQLSLSSSDAPNISISHCNSFSVIINTGRTTTPSQPPQHCSGDSSGGDKAATKAASEASRPARAVQRPRHLSDFVSQ